MIIKILTTMFIDPQYSFLLKNGACVVLLEVLHLLKSYGVVNLFVCMSPLSPCCALKHSLQFLNYCIGFINLNTTDIQIAGRFCH